MTFQHMLARPGRDFAEVAKHPDWIGQEKIDGIRVFFTWDGSRLRLITRGGRNIADLFPNLVNDEQVRILAGTRSFCIDGELTLLGQTVSDWTLRDLLARVNGSPPVMLRASGGPRFSDGRVSVFDLLQVNGGLITAMPLSDRLERLARLREPLVSYGFLGLEPMVAHSDQDELFQATRLGRLEGVMAKRLSAPYLQGRRSHAWLKFKHRYDVMLIGFGYSASTSPSRPFGALRLAALDDDGKARMVGWVGSGFTRESMAEVKAMLDRGEFPLVRVSCLGRTESGLREPVMMGEIQASAYTEALFSQFDNIPFM